MPSAEPPETALEDLCSLLPLAGPPGGEQDVAEFLRQRLVAMGVPAECIFTDRAQGQSEYGGTTGNLVVRLEGESGPRRVFSAHMDTVPLAVGCRPRLDEQAGRIVNDNPDSALGGDNRTGCAVLLHAARTALSLPAEARPPLALAFFIQEEVGLVGARGLDLSLLGDPRPEMCFNFDGGPADELVTAVIGTERFTIEVEGIASHAGAHPAGGVSAAVIASRALAKLADGGWHGRIEHPGGTGSANVGRIEGGSGTNIVMPRLEMLAEARSHSREFRQEILAAWRGAFTEAAQETTNAEGRTGVVRFGPGPTYEPFALEDDAPVVRAALEAASQAGFTARPVSNDGGMDANWIVAHGIPAVTIGAGQREVHTTGEWIDLGDFARACTLAALLAGGR